MSFNSVTARLPLSKLVAVVLVLLVVDLTVDSVAGMVVIPVLPPATSAVAPTTLPVIARLRL